MISAWFAPPGIEMLNLDPVSGHFLEWQSIEDAIKVEEKTHGLMATFRERTLPGTRFFLVGWALTRAFRPLIQGVGFLDLLTAGPVMVEKVMAGFRELVISSVPQIFRGRAGLPPERPCVLGALSREKFDNAATEQEWPPGVANCLLRNEAFLLWLEVRHFISAVEKWLGDPQSRRQVPVNPLSEGPLVFFNWELFYYWSRLHQTRTVLFPMEIRRKRKRRKQREIAIGYEVVSETLLPLAWAELAMALQWGISATFCPECGGLMPEGRQKTCGDADCLRTHRERRLAALENRYRKDKGLPLIEDVTEAARAYNRRKQRDSRRR